ncbi:MFS transporter [Campylobacter molothri]|uniref:MFS transporter n=1 Tax=Campylobacter molothri TaxID=1032242 RepID=UPI00301BD53E
MQNSFLFNMQRIGVAFIIFSVYVVFSASWASTGSLMPLIKADLGLDNQKATLITSIVVVAKIFGTSFTAFLIYKFGLKKGYFLGCLLMSSSVFLAFIRKLSENFNHTFFNGTWFSLCISMFDSYYSTMV